MTHPLQRLALAAVAVALMALPALAQTTLPPFKDRQFAYPSTLTSEFGGDYRVFAYDKARQAQGRGGAVKGQRIGPKFASLGVRRTQEDLVVSTPAGDIAHVAVGRRAGASLIVIYLHGRGGSRKLGVDDFSAGGNFNRLKNLVADAGGLYLSPDFSEFGAQGATEVGALIAHYTAASPGAPVFLACASMGGAICYWLSEDTAIAPRLGGLLLLGSYPDDTFLASAAFRRRVPVLIAQGINDPVYAVEWLEAFFSDIRAAAPGYPIKMICFEKGTHGSPVRMIDWRESINWMLSLR